jgi:outer membrane assembly lipoprotein YfiO
MIKRLTIILIFAATLAACSSSAPTELPAKELVKASNMSVDTPQSELFRNAKRYYASELYSLAKESFESLKDSYPSGPYVEFAAIKSADCDFELRDYVAAASGYEKFASDHPSSASAPYALLLAARSYQLSSRGVGRDVSPIQQASELYQKVMERYPGTPYAIKAKGFMIETAGTLAEQERFIADFYNKRDNEKAAEARQAGIKETYKTIVQKAQTAAETVPVAVATPLPLPEPLEKVYEPPAKSVQQPADDSDEDIDPSVPFIQRVECTLLHSPTVFLYLNRSPDDLAALQKSNRFIGGSGMVVMKLPGIRARGSTIDCFSKNDLSISRDGTVTIRGSRSATLMALDTPPRLLIEVVK